MRNCKGGIMRRVLLAKTVMDLLVTTVCKPVISLAGGLHTH